MSPSLPGHFLLCFIHQNFISFFASHIVFFFFLVFPVLFPSPSFLTHGALALPHCHYVQCPCNRDINGLWTGGPDSCTINLHKQNNKQIKEASDGEKSSRKNKGGNKFWISFVSWGLHWKRHSYADGYKIYWSGLLHQDLTPSEVKIVSQCNEIGSGNFSREQDLAII